MFTITGTVAAVSPSPGDAPARFLSSSSASEKLQYKKKPLDNVCKYLATSAKTRTFQTIKYYFYVPLSQVVRLVERILADERCNENFTSIDEKWIHEEKMSGRGYFGKLHSGPQQIVEEQGLK